MQRNDNAARRNRDAAAARALVPAKHPRQWFWRKGPRRPTVSPSAAKEFLAAGMSPYAIAQSLFGGPQWMPAGYTPEQAESDVRTYIQSGKFLHERWSDMDLGKLPPALKPYASSRALGGGGVLGALRGVREPDDRRRVAVLVAWLGGVKPGRRSLKASYFKALDPIDHPGMLQRVFEAYKVSGNKSVGGGEADYRVLKIGKVARLVEAGSNVEGIVSKAEKILNDADKQRSEAELQRITLEATRATLQSHSDTMKSFEKDRQVQLRAARLEGKMNASKNIDRRLHDLMAGKQLTKEAYSRFVLESRKSFDDYIADMEAVGADKRLIDALQGHFRRTFATSAMAPSPEAAEQATINEAAQITLVERLSALLTGMAPQRVTQALTNISPQLRKAEFKKLVRQAARLIWAQFNSKVIQADARDDMLASLALQVQVPRSANGQGYEYALSPEEARAVVFEDHGIMSATMETVSQELGGGEWGARAWQIMKTRVGPITAALAATLYGASDMAGRFAAAAIRAIA